MKRTALMLLFAIAVTSLSPVSILSLPIDGHDQPLLGSLDVCNSAAPALSGGGMMPCINALPFHAMPLMDISDAPAASSLFLQLILSTLNDRPPRS